MTKLATCAVLALLAPACLDSNETSRPGTDQIDEDGPHAPPATSCGELTCLESQYCEVVVSDIPEFENQSYERYRCKPVPACDRIDLCECIGVTERCEYGGSEFGGTCDSSGTGYQLTCAIGG